MSTLTPFLVLDQTCEQVVIWINQQLTSTNYRIVRTFDLQVARLAHPDCPCPHHENSECNCQMVILLVYRKQEAPVTLVVHGQDGRSWVSLASVGGKHINQYLESSIRRILIDQVSNVLFPTEVPYESRPSV